MTQLSISTGDPKIDRTPFYRACFYGHVSVVQFLLKRPKVDVIKHSNEWATPFFAACQNSHNEVVSLLLADMRIDFNKPMNDGVTCWLT